jgi:hypothetical protein
LSKGSCFAGLSRAVKIFARIQNFNQRGNEKRKGIGVPVDVWVLWG